MGLVIQQLLQHQILEAIKLYRSCGENCTEFKSIKTLVKDKKILCYLAKDNLPQIKYRCAIAFPLANWWQISPLTVAHKLKEFLPATTVVSTRKSEPEFQLQVVSPGWIDFYLSDRALAIWLEEVLEWIEQGDEGDEEDKEDRGDKGDLFALQYVYARCSALLRLGEQEKLIKIKNQYATTWEIVEPSPISWSDARGNFLLVHPTEKRLLVKLITTVEQLIVNSHKTNWAKLAHSLGQVWLDFWTKCRVWGEIKQEKPELAIARLGLVAIVQNFLHRLLQDKLSISPLNNL